MTCSQFTEETVVIAKITVTQDGQPCESAYFCVDDRVAVSETVIVFVCTIQDLIGQSFQLEFSSHAKLTVLGWWIHPDYALQLQGIAMRSIVRTSIQDCQCRCVYSRTLYKFDCASLQVDCRVKENLCCSTIDYVSRNVRWFQRNIIQP